ncbi:LysR family transcriptional regulator [Leeuwenhoekiella nanhaiensis]|uniref:LysR family transcriptional regulator n=1 Tax=Leeuwenhoekiella nanhaiensis TaxID=1655491 RepID=A0A2G1VPK3_9FLAO|nr:LysR family transcriptional regulator [Leeuwenhoekiella nanhaiensis]PHQ28695.1 LysR family transcriptional regulator [Leeuwenhoekiella nanhaiensis]
MVNLEWYRTFVAIFEKNTLTKAAESLYSSQPGVSVHLNALEAYVGKKLFERTSRKMIPTEEGKQLYHYIIDAVEKLEKAEQHFKKTSNAVIPSINIGMCTETFQTILEAEVPTFKFNLIARFGNHQNLIKELNNGILDLVITPKPKDKHSLVNYEAFTQEKIVLVAGSQSNLESIVALIEDQNFTGLEQELKSRVWYSASNEMEHFRRFWFENFRNRVDFKPNYILPNIGSIIRCIENAEGFAVVPDFLVTESLKSQKVKLVWSGKKEVANTLYFATRSDLQFKEEVELIKAIFKQKMNPIA